MRKCENFSPYMRRPSVIIYDFATDPSEFPYILEKFHFLFYQCDAGNPTFTSPSSLFPLILSLRLPLWPLEDMQFQRTEGPPRMQMRRPPSHTLPEKKLRHIVGMKFGKSTKQESSVQHWYKYNDCVLYDIRGIA